MYISRISKDNREQLTANHLKSVSEYASLLASKFRVSGFLLLAALLHDMGKLSLAFLAYVRECAEADRHCSGPRRGSVVHSTQGARYIYEASADEDELTRLTAAIIAVCVAGHHSGLMDGVSLKGARPLYSRLSEDNPRHSFGEVKSAFEAMGILPRGFDEMLGACKQELESFLETCRSERLSCAFMLHLLTKSIFSCLVDADRYDAYCFEVGRTPERILPRAPWTDLIDRLERHLAAYPLNSEIDRIRRMVSDSCLSAASYPIGVYRLDVPTGGGKTLSSLRFALHHAQEHGMDRIIYVIPYLSVLEQTADTIREALQCGCGDDFILEHHSNVIPPENEEKAQADRLLTDRWDSPIVITTMVQFLESIYSAKGSKLRKLHNMANAVLIFDEVQSQPVKCIHLFNGAIDYLRAFGCSTSLLCTATQPPLDQVERPIHLSEPRDLVQDTSEIFRSLKRTRIVDSTVAGGYTVDRLRDFVLDKLELAGDCLVVLNTKRHAANLYRSVQSYINEQTRIAPICLVHLSTSMCPAHRLCVIEGVKKRLGKERVLCVSTQLIEAGVHISFGCVVRALAGLDSIAQAAGRCNRNGEFPEGREVYLVNLADEDLSRLPDIKRGREETERILRAMKADDKLYEGDLLSAAAMRNYYDRYFHKRDMDYMVGDASIYDMLSRNRAGMAAYQGAGGKNPTLLPQAFETAGKSFCVIEKDTASVLVPYGHGRRLVDQYAVASLSERGRVIREMGRYSVGVPDYELAMLTRKGALTVLDDGIVVLDASYYDEALGLVM